MPTAALPDQLFSAGHALDKGPDKLGLMRDSSDAAGDPAELTRRLEADGYLLMKGGLDRDQVLAARADLTAQLAAAGALDERFPAMDGICKAGTGYLFKPEMTNRSAPVQQLLFSGRLVEFYRRLFGEPILHYDYTWMRAIGPGKGTNPHCDLPYMGRGTHRHLTCWVPYGEFGFDVGGLMVLEGSHQRMDLLKSYVFRDVDTFCENEPRQVEAVKTGRATFTGALSHNPPTTRNKFGGRWVTAEFEPGDFVTFGMFTVHASTDNPSENRIRISSDSRYQRASDRVDERWVGPNLTGHTLAGKRGRIC